MRLFNGIEKTYKTQANAIKAVQKKHPALLEKYSWVVCADEDGRFFVVFIGQQCLSAGIHFHYPVTC